MDRREHHWNEHLAGRHAPGAWAALEAGYGEPHRAYHDRGHIDHLIAALDENRRLARRPDLILAAIYWHDGVYSTQRADGSPRPDAENVRASADAFLQFSRLSAPETADVEELIMATADHVGARASRPELQADMDLFLDLDLSPLALPWEQFAANGEAIRREFAWIPEREFLIGHIGVLGRFGGAKKLFRRDETFAKWEHVARENIARRIPELEGRLAAM